VKYVDRIIRPINYFSQALTYPQYSQYVQTDPTPAQLAAALADRTFFNYVPGPYDPTNIAAIVDATNINADRQAIHGLDLSASYQWGWSEFGTLRVLANASFLHSEEQIDSDQPNVQLAGTVFNPPHWRGRAGAMWNRQALTLTTFVNYIGGVEDTRLTPPAPVSPMTTMDVTGRYRIGSLPRFLDSVDLTLSVLNLFNKEPSYMKSTFVTEPPYDTTNYSGVGRFVNFGITANW
jgi:iron complex outermembrane receptor protein